VVVARDVVPTRLLLVNMEAKGYQIVKQKRKNIAEGKQPNGIVDIDVDVGEVKVQDGGVTVKPIFHEFALA